jgi:hypothetical protein
MIAPCRGSPGMPPISRRFRPECRSFSLNPAHAVSGRLLDRSRNLRGRSCTKAGAGFPVERPC